MKLRVLKKTREEFKIEIEGESHTLSNILESALLEDENVEFAGYNVPHPLFPKSIISIRMKKNKSAENALEKASEKILKKCGKFSTGLQNAFNRYENKK